MGRMTQAAEAMGEAQEDGEVASLRPVFVGFLPDQLLIYRTELGELGSEIDEVERLYAEKVRNGSPTRGSFISAIIISSVLTRGWPFVYARTKTNSPPPSLSFTWRTGSSGPRVVCRRSAVIIW